MNGNKRVYDLIVSLGANCSAAHNLRLRGLRPFSLPFDWCYFRDEKPLCYLTQDWPNRLSGFCLKENLRPLSKEEYSSAHPDREQYKDERSGYYFVNHFNRKLDEHGEYERVKAKLERRINRLFERLEKAEKVLFILSPDFALNPQVVQSFHKRLASFYPGKTIDLEALLFSSPRDGEEHPSAGLQLRFYKRTLNDYDFYRTNYEWSFLDDVAYSFPMKKRKIRLLSCSLGAYRLSLDFSRRDLDD